MFYYRRKKYGGMKQQPLKRLKELEDENNRLKQMYADVSLDNKILKEVISKKKAFRQKSSCKVSHQTICNCLRECP